MHVGSHLRALKYPMDKRPTQPDASSQGVYRLYKGCFLFYLSSYEVTTYRLQNAAGAYNL